MKKILLILTTINIFAPPKSALKEHIAEQKTFTTCEERYDAMMIVVAPVVNNGADISKMFYEDIETITQYHKNGDLEFMLYRMQHLRDESQQYSPTYAENKTFDIVTETANESIVSDDTPTKTH